jgi:ubiquinone/menaquinone biosynthesis C-methylase UbiE
MTVARDVFTNGWYAEQFRPDSGTDPFRRLYAAKRRDVVTMVGGMAAETRVLDLGGGMGRIAVPLAREHRVTLCDISTSMLEMAGAAAAAAALPRERLELRQVDASVPLPFADDSFDCAVATDLLCHLPDPVATLRELRRVVAPGGQLIVDSTNRSPWWTLRYPGYVGPHPRRWLRTLEGGGVLPEWQDIVRHHTRHEFLALLGAAGWHVVEERDYGPRYCPKWFLTRCWDER